MQNGSLAEIFKPETENQKYFGSHSISVVSVPHFYKYKSIFKVHLANPNILVVSVFSNPGKLVSQKSITKISYETKIKRCD